MPRKKKDESVIQGLPEAELTVQKSLPLFSLWSSDLTLAEFKIIDLYLSRINSHCPERKAVMLEKGEFEKALGLQKINTADLEKRLRHLMGTVVKVEDRGENRGFRLVTLFAESDAEPDKDGIWQIKLECTQKAMKYFFNVESIGYLRYKLRSIIQIKSRYSYVLFCYLEKNRFRKSWEVELEELKAILNCQEESYQEFKIFKNRILEQCHAELNQKTECKFDYETVKRGRYVKRIRFTVHDLPASEAPDLPAPKVPELPMKPGRPKKEVIYCSGELGEAELEAIQRVLRE